MAGTSVKLQDLERTLFYVRSTQTTDEAWKLQHPAVSTTEPVVYRRQQQKAWMDGDRKKIHWCEQKSDVLWGTEVILPVQRDRIKPARETLQESCHNCKNRSSCNEDRYSRNYISEGGKQMGLVSPVISQLYYSINNLVFSTFFLYMDCNVKYPQRGWHP